MVFAYLWFMCKLVRFRQYTHEQGIIVQHLFKMWREPFCICAVTRKSTTYLVVDAAIDHFIEAEQCLFQRFFIICKMIMPQQVLYRKALRKFGRLAKPTPFLICISENIAGDRLQLFLRKKTASPGFCIPNELAVSKCAVRFSACEMISSFFSSITFMNAFQYFFPARAAIGPYRWKISTAKKRFCFGC
jgi:hypothetical protein